MRSILNSSENNDSSQAQSEQPAYEAATSPGGGSTSLDRVPRSPVTSVKSNDTATPTSAGPTPSKYNASPLTFQTSTSQLVPSSPPLSPTSPTRHSTSTSPITLDPSTTTNRSGAIFKSHSDKALKGSSSQDSKKLKVKSISLDGSASSVKEIMSVKGMIAEPLPEENTEDDELMEQDPKTEIAGKKESSKTRIRDNFFRRSKSRKKAMTILGGGPDVERAITESYSKDSGGTGAVRAKSAKQRPKLDDVFFSSDTNKTLPAEQEAEKSEGTTKEKRSPRKPGREHRRDSDSSLIHSPTSTTPDPSLCAVNEQKGSDPNTLSPAPLENMSDSDREEVSQQLVRSMSESHPELEIKEDMNWQRTMDRKLLRKMNKHERDRQNIMHELIQTERHHFRALHVLKLVFKNQMEKYLSEESLEIMFPELDNLIEISKSFLDRLEERRGKEGANIIVDDISDILLEEYTGENKERIINTFGEFCTYHLIAAEMYKEQLKKKQFGRLVQHLYRVKECQRLYLPDYYTSVSQRLTKMVQFLARLVKKTDMLKLDHTERLRQCQQELETLVTAVNQHVDNRKNQIELEQIQDKLEIVLSRSAAKHPVLKTMKELNLTAQNRRLIKKGDAQLIHGHGKQLPVHIVLVTDLVVLLTERDQKYFVPAILDLKPPIIRLYDLHVRVNASVRSGVQLLLLEKGSAPEMFRLEFKTKKEAKEWEVTLTDAGDVCKEKGIKCEFFGSEPVIMEDEKVEERRSPLTMRVRRSESQRSTASPTPSLSTSHTPSLRRIKSARATLDSARKVLSMFVTNSSSTTTDLTNSPRHARATITTGGGSTSSAWFNQSPKNRHNTIHLLKSGEMISQPAMIDRETSIDIDGGGGGGSKKTQKSKIKRKGLDRSSTFKGRSEDKKEKERAGAGGGGGGNEAVDTVQQQQLLICAVRMKDTIGDLLKVCEEKDVEIERLKQQLEEARDAMAATPTVIMTRNKISPRNSPPMFRPHSCHIDITDLSNSSLSQPIPEDDHESLTQPADTGT